MKNHCECLSNYFPDETDPLGQVHVLDKFKSSETTSALLLNYMIEYGDIRMLHEVSERMSKQHARPDIVDAFSKVKAVVDRFTIPDHIADGVHPKMPVKKCESEQFSGRFVTRVYTPDVLYDLWFCKDGVRIGAHLITWDEIPEEFLGNHA